jgi:translocation and assembly module TamB
VPLSGRTTGSVDLTFPGTDYKQASGSLTSQITADTSETTSDRIPLTGDVVVSANRGNFDLQRVNLQTPATRLLASGQFSFEGDSNLQVDLNSSNATELQSVLIDSGLLPDASEQLRTYGIGIAGQMAFNGTIRGKLGSPDINGKVSLGSLLLNGNEVGSLSAAIAMTAAELRVTDGRLTQADGGGVQFSLASPRSGQNNTTLDATLNRLNAETLITALPLSQAIRDRLADTRSQVSGQVRIAGIPNEMAGSADLRFSPGTLAGEPLEGLTARATFTGANVNVESIDARLAAGHLVGSGNFSIASKRLEFQGKAEGIQLARLATLTDRPALQTIAGVGDFSVHFIGNLNDRDFSGYEVNFDGQARDVTVNGRAAGNIALVGKTQDKQLNVTLTTGILGQPQVVSARVNLASERLPATIETTLNNAELTNLLGIVLPPHTVTISGRANGTIKAAGDLLDEDGYFSIAGLSGTASFSELGFRIEDIALNATAPLVINFTPSEVTFSSTRFTGPGSNIVLDGMLATGANGKQNLNIDGDLNLRVLNGLSPDFFSSGTANVAMRITGTYEQPRLIGTADVANGSVSLLLGNERWTVTNLRTTVRFTANQAQIDSLTGSLGGGHVDVSGGALLEGFTVAAFRLSTHAENVNVPFPENFRSLLDADVEIKGSSHEQLISGLVNLRRAEYTEDIELADLINSRRAESLEEGAEIELIRTALFAGLRVEGRNALVVRNNLADLVGSVSLQLNGPVADPVISGRITATSGTLNFRNDRYDITRALMDLPPARNADPVLNIQGESQIRGYRVIVSLTGPLSHPSAVVRSEPALPQADVVSLITTGQLASGDTSASILSQSGLGTATSLLTDALINAPAQRATSKLFGLSRFEINPVITGYGQSPAARLTLGKRISKEVTVTYSTNVASDPNQILALEYRVSDRLSFVAQYEQASTRRLTARNNSFSFEIRFRKRF